MSKSISGVVRKRYSRRLAKDVSAGGEQEMVNQRSTKLALVLHEQVDEQSLRGSHNKNNTKGQIVRARRKLRILGLPSETVILADINETVCRWVGRNNRKQVWTYHIVLVRGEVKANAVVTLGLRVKNARRRMKGEVKQ